MARSAGLGAGVCASSVLPERPAQPQRRSAARRAAIRTARSRYRPRLQPVRDAFAISSRACLAARSSAAEMVGGQLEAQLTYMPGAFLWSPGPAAFRSPGLIAAVVLRSDKSGRNPLGKRVLIPNRSIRPASISNNLWLWCSSRCGIGMRQIRPQLGFLLVFYSHRRL